MNRTAVIVGVVAVALILTAVSAVTAWALLGGDAVQAQEIQIKQVERAPAQVVDPVIEYEPVSRGHYGMDGDCPYSSTKLQMTQAPADKLEQEPLAQVAP